MAGTSPGRVARCAAPPRVHDLRLMADYDDEPVTGTQALRALRRSRELVAAVVRGGDGA